MNDETQRIIDTATKVGRLEIINTLYWHIRKLAADGETKIATELFNIVNDVEKQIQE